MSWWSATSARTLIDVLEEFKDQGTADFLTGLMEQHEQMAWMLRSFIEGESLAPDGQQPQAKTPTASHA